MIPSQFRITTQPIAESGATIRMPQARFTILTSRFIRMEYDPADVFEDRPSQIFWFRQQPIPRFEVKYKNNGCEIITEHLKIVYTGSKFRKESLSVVSRDKRFTWHFGDVDQANLGGTARTLDGVSGQTRLEPGLISQDGWTVIDDSRGLVFNDDGWLEPRNTGSDVRDIYFLGYGHDYLACLRDYSKVSGAVPVLPRWVLGNWWSRYWAYSQQELTELMLDFQVHQVPLAVCITDMDWHLDGWTGYTWNRTLFPDPSAYLKFLHNLGLHTALNLHPASGVGSHEEAYPEMAQAMGINPASKRPVEFDIENPAFAEAYFAILHHPLEEQGVDFWWMDWQQGNPTRLQGLNLLWWINHLHFLDLGREGKKRSFIFSRWGGLGNHRYPIGFSGDTVVTWDSLAFQPYFTATAANVGYGWWSHDIGGHMHGVEDAELYTRWVQFGTFSPILRLHSTKNPFHERRPWGYDSGTYQVTQRAMQLRHALIPYLYSMSWRNHVSGTPLILPMYYLAPDVQDAYACPNQYAFGSELVVAPITTPRDPDTRLARQVVWLPEGDWYDFFNDWYCNGGGWQAVYGDLDAVPVFARAGAIIPLAPLPIWGGLDNPADLTIHVFPGTDNHYDLYEDDGASNAYLDGQYVVTSFKLDWGSKEQMFTIQTAQGDTVLIPPVRNYTLVFHAVQEPQTVDLLLNEIPTCSQVVYAQGQHRLRIEGLTLKPDDRLEVRLKTQPRNVDCRADVVRTMLRAFRLGTDTKNAINVHLDKILDQTDVLETFQTGLEKSQIRALVEVIAGCGVEHTQKAGEELLVLWNRSADKRFRFSISSEDVNGWDPFTRSSLKKERAKGSQIYRPAQDFTRSTLVTVHYGDLLKIVLSFAMDEIYPHPQDGLF